MSTFDTRAALVVELTQWAVGAPDVPSAVKPILTAFLDETAAVGSAYFQTGGAAFHARAAAGDLPAGPVMESILVHGLPRETPLMAALTQTTVPLFIDDTRTDPAAPGFPELGVASLAAAPVRDRGGNLLGAFLMHTFTPHAWTAREADLIAAVASAMSALTARLVAEEEAVNAREGALRALGLALECRDRETKGHTDRVTALALHIGDAMGLPDADLAALRWGSYLHDVGKLAVADTILHKPGGLTDAEWTQMRGHAALGHAFADELRFLPHDALAVVRHHHERWDGSGYPDGLANEAIPLLARIFAVCDVWDALTSRRPYKAAWPADAARREIANAAGTQFDPAVVDVFLALTADAVVAPSLAA